jgi:hypothetical protein
VCVRACVCYTMYTDTHTNTHKQTHTITPLWVRFRNERNQGKQAHPVSKYRVPHGSQAHLKATGMPSQQSNSDSLRFRRAAAFYKALKSKFGLAAAKAVALRINLNLEGCGIVAPAPLLPPPLSHSLPFPRVH